MDKPFRGICPECRKNEVILKGPRDVQYCSRLCATNAQYKKRFEEKRGK